MQVLSAPNPVFSDSHFEELQKQLTPDVIKLYLQEAYEYAQQSPDPSNQNGAILVDPDCLYDATEHLLGDCNRTAPGIEATPEILADRTKKYAYVEHAERNLIYRAASEGIYTAGQIIICPWFACAECARAISCARIGLIVGHLPRIREFERTRGNLSDEAAAKWSPSVTEGDYIMEQGGVRRIYFEEPLGLDFEILINERPWRP